MPAKIVIMLLKLTLQFNNHFIYFLSAIRSLFLFHVLLFNCVINYKIIYYQ